MITTAYGHRSRRGCALLVAMAAKGALSLLANCCRTTQSGPRIVRGTHATPSATASSLPATPCDTAGDLATPPATLRHRRRPCDTADGPCNAPETSRGVAPAIRRPCLRRAEI